MLYSLFLFNLCDCRYEGKYEPTKVDSYNDNYCKISTEYLSEMINFFGRDSATIKQYNWLNNELNLPGEDWIREVQSDGTDSNICQVMKKYYYTARFNLEYKPRFPLMIEKTISNFHAQLRSGCEPSRISRITRTRIVDLKNFLNSGSNQCDKKLFTSESIDQGSVLIPRLTQRPYYNGTHCYSKWSYSTSLENVFVPEVLENSSYVVHNNFLLGTNQKIFTKPPNFFPSNPISITITRRDQCPNSNLTWYLWRNRATSTIRREQEPDSFSSSLSFDLEDSDDCNRNLIPDHLELELSDGKRKPCVSLDCVNVDDILLIPAECEKCFSLDIDNNQIPDQCQDCNENGISDPTEILNHGAHRVDRNNNGILDSCENYFPPRHTETSEPPHTTESEEPPHTTESQEPPHTTESEEPPPSTEDDHTNEELERHKSETDCDYNEEDDGIEIFLNPDLDSDKNGVLDICEHEGSCYSHNQCKTTTKVKCSVFIGGLFNPNFRCPELLRTVEPVTTNTDSDEETSTQEEQTDPENTSDEDQPYLGSCIVRDGKKCLENMNEIDCYKLTGDWAEKECWRRREPNEPEEEENLVQFEDTFTESPSSNNNQDIAIGITVGFVGLWTIVLFVMLSIFK